MLPERFRRHLLRTIRRSLHLTQADVAKPAGPERIGRRWRRWTQSKVSTCERGARSLDVETFLLLLEAMLRQVPAERREKVLVDAVRQLAEQAVAQERGREIPATDASR
jgi:hypothetical protein